MEKKQREEVEKQFCGIVMPISEIDGCSESHWQDVRRLIQSCIESVGMRAGLVSESMDVGIIQKRIVQNLYDCPIVVCDVSGRNPNVMFELGLRLAFNRPTIILKDDVTPFSFDTSMIEHIIYPRTMRHYVIEDVKEKVIAKLRYLVDGIKTSTLKNFLDELGPIKVPEVPTVKVSQESFQYDNLMQKIEEIYTIVGKNVMYSIPQHAPATTANSSDKDDYDVEVCCGLGVAKSVVDFAYQKIRKIGGLELATLIQVSKNHFHIAVKLGGDPTSYTTHALKKDVTTVIDLAIPKRGQCRDSRVTKTIDDF